MSRLAHPVALRNGAIVLAIVAALAIAIAFFPWNVLRGPVAAHFTHRLDRQVTIAGDLQVHLGFPIRVVANDVSIANVGWSDVQPMANARQIVLTYSWHSLLHLTPER